MAKIRLFEIFQLDHFCNVTDERHVFEKLMEINKNLYNSHLIKSHKSFSKYPFCKHHNIHLI